MAKYDGIFDIEGTLKGMTFYKAKDGSTLIRTKGGVSKQRIMNDPNFARTRENGMEFAHNAKMGQLVRRSVSSLLQLAKDSRVSSRLTSQISKVKNLDSVSARGERKFWIGLTESEGKLLMQGFDFNQNAKFGSIFGAQYSYDSSTATFNATDFVSANDVALPEGCTHFSLRVACSLIDFEAFTFITKISDAENFALSMTPSTVTIAPTEVPSGDGFLFHFVMIEFFQERNGEQYPLKNNAFNCLNLLEVGA
ncbi:MAG: hypothetical protein ACPHVL_02385 [Psychroflexus salarius]